MKTRGLGLVAAVFVVFLLTTWAFDTTALAGAQRQHLHWNYFSHVIMVVLAVAAIALGKKDHVSYGLTLKRWRSDLSIALVCLVMAAGYAPSWLHPAIAGNGPLNTLFGIAAVLLTAWLVLRKKTEAVESPGRRGLWIVLAIPIVIAVASASAGSTIIASTAIFQFFFAGSGEEIFFRGYIQSRLDEDLGRPWKLRGVSFGPGLLIGSALFGVLHLLNPFNPFKGEFGLAILWGIDSFFAGLLFGLVREKTGTVLSASLAHGLVDLGQILLLPF